MENLRHERSDDRKESVKSVHCSFLLGVVPGLPGSARVCHVGASGNSGKTGQKCLGYVH